MHKLIGFLLASLLACSAHAAELALELVDAEGQPLAEAVLWISPGPSVPAPVDAAPTQAPVMDQIKRKFVPYVLPVQTGSTVLFPNSDTINHHVYSFSPAKRFELRLHHQGDVAQKMRFDTPGLITLGCNIHDWMLGFILVLDTPLFATTDASGRASIDFQPAAGQQLHLWHPRLSMPLDSLKTLVPQPGPLRIQLDQPLKRDPRPAIPKKSQGRGNY